MSTKNNVLAKTAIRKLTGHISFADILLSLRMTQEMTQVQMSTKLGISKQDLCNIEKGRKDVSVQRAVAFAKSLNMPVKVFAKYVLQDQLKKVGIKGEVEIKDVA